MPRNVDIVSHWHHSVENLTTSSLDFYSSLEASLRAKDIPALLIDRVDWSEGGIMSVKRTYLRIGYARFFFDISAFPFGKDFMFSWWLGKTIPSMAGIAGCLAIVLTPVALLLFVATMGLVKGVIVLLIAGTIVALMTLQNVAQGDSAMEDALMAVPILGQWYKRLFRPSTYYSEDTRIVFEETVHRVMLEHVGALLSVSKLPPLSVDQAKAKGRELLA